MSICVCVLIWAIFYVFVLNVLLLPFIKVQKLNDCKKVPKRKVKKGQDLRFSNFFAKNCLKIAAQFYFFCLCHSFTWTHDKICMDKHLNLHEQTTEYALTHKF